MAASEHDLSFHGNPRNIQHTTKVARLSNQTEAGVVKLYGEQSENFLERQYGRLFAVADLSFTADTYDVAEVLVDTFEREFYANLNQSVGESFESALTAVNQTLADLAAEGQNDWVGKLNAVLGVLAEDTIHVSQVGNAHAFLIRGHSTTHISEGLSGPGGAGQPGGQATAKTFLNVASGRLELGDKLLFSTAELFNRASQRDVQRYLALNAPTRAIRKLADHLTADSAKAPGRLATVVVELTTIDLVSSEPVSHEPDEIVLGAPRGHFERLQRLKSFRQAGAAGQAGDAARKFWDKRLKPGVGHGLAVARYQVARLQARRAGVEPPPPPAKTIAPRPAAGTPETVRVPREERGGSGHGEPGRSGRSNAARTANAQAPDPAAASGTGIASLPSRVALWVTAGKAQAGKLWQRSGIPQSSVSRQIGARTAAVRSRISRLPVVGQLFGERRSLYRNLVIVIGLVFALSLVMSIRAAGANREEASVRERIKEVESIQAKAEASVIIKDGEAARAQASQAKTKADELGREKRLKGEIATLQQSVNTSYDRIAGIIAAPGEPAADLAGAAGGKPVTGMAITGATVLAVGDGSPLVSYNTTSKELKPINPSPGITGSVKSLATASNGDVLALTDKPTVYQLDAASGAAAEASVGGGGTWEPGVAIDTVQQNIFLLSPSQNQIFRHARTLSAFNKGDAYFGSDVDVKNAVDVVSGAQVYVLSGNGSVQQFVGGSSQPFALKPPPEPSAAISSPVALAANFTANTLYIADPAAKRVVEYTTKGEYVRQFRQDAFGDTKDILVDDKTNTLFVLAGGKLYQVTLG